MMINKKTTKYKLSSFNLIFPFVDKIRACLEFYYKSKLIIRLAKQIRITVAAAPAPEGVGAAATVILFSKTFQSLSIKPFL